MSHKSNHRSATLFGATRDPLPREKIWDWALRVRDFGCLNIGVEGMRELWSYAELRCHSADLHSFENITVSDDHPLSVMYDEGLAMCWGKYVFFTSEHEMVVFKLLFSKYITELTVVERHYVEQQASNN